MKMLQSAKNSLIEFRTFAMRPNAIDLAIGVAIGAGFTAVVNAIVAGLFTPLIAAIFGKQDFSTLYFTINGSQFHYGLLVNALISFVVVAFTLFFFVVKPLNAVRRRLGLDDQVSPAMAPCVACTLEVPVAATRCPHCTSTLEEGWSQQSTETPASSRELGAVERLRRRQPRPRRRR
jgi:large conductance mechanosensitive channel